MTLMIQDTINACQEKILFKNNVTDYQTRRQKVVLHTLLAISMFFLLTSIYLFSQWSWMYGLMMLSMYASTFTAALVLSRLFNTGIIRQRYPDRYRSWCRWDRKGFENGSIKKLEVQFTKWNIKTRREKLLISRIEERIDSHNKHLAKINSVAGAALTITFGSLVSTPKMLLLSLFLISVFWILAFTIWQAVGTFSGIDDLRDLRRLLSEASFAR